MAVVTSLWRLLLIPVVAIVIGASLGGLGLLQYRSPEAAVSIGVMGSIVALMALSISIGYELVRRRKYGGRSGSYSRARFVGMLASMVGPTMLGMWATGMYFGRGGPLLLSIAIATLATAVGVSIMVPLIWWLLPRFDARFR